MIPRNHDLQYTPKSRKINPTMKIYCEGDTEYYYFQYLRSVLRFNNLNVIPVKTKEAQTQLITIVEETIIREGINSDSEDSVWCVIDVEENKQNWGSTIKKINQFQDNKNKFVIISNPSFEVWLLSFFRYSTKRYTNSELCDELTKLLNVKNYSRDVKGRNIVKYIDYFKDVKKAIDNSQKQIKFHKDQDRDLLEFESNPLTQIYLILEKLQVKEIK